MEKKEITPDPSIMFTSFVMGLASAAMLELGLMEDPETHQKRIRLDHAKQHIDLIEMIKVKTVGNLSTEEKQLLDQVMVDLKLQYAKVAS